MTPKRISLKNFLSFGEPAVEFIFTADEPLWVLCGPNGVGKSAVFDAITYALYGEHRGGGQKAEQLVRHGTNGFEVELDFEFNGVEYRIRRTRPRKQKGRTTQHLLRRIEGSWKCVRGNDPAGAVTADDIKEWVVDTLKLGYKAFTSSVLLRQGEADKLFSASRDERLAVLKGIIGFENFESLSARVHSATATQANRAEGFRAQLAAVQPVGDEELIAAGQTVVDAETLRDTSHDALTQAVERVGQARQWENLEKQRGEFSRLLAEADERQKQGRQIREDKCLLDDLVDAVPVLEELFSLRTLIAKTDADRTAASDVLATRTAERDASATAAEQARQKAGQHTAQGNAHGARAKELAHEIEQGSKFLSAADAIVDLEMKLSAFTPELDEQYVAAGAEEAVAVEAEREAATAKTRTETVLSRANDDQQRFSGVAVGAICSQCRQLVDESHAEKERSRLAEDVQARQADLDRATTDAEMAGRRLTAANAARRALEKTKVERDKLASQRDTRRNSLETIGITTDATKLRAQLAGKDGERVTAERNCKAERGLAESATADATRHDHERARLDASVKTADGVVRKSDNDLATARGQEAMTYARLSDAWKERLPRTTAETVVALAATRDRLIAEGVDKQFRAMEQDEVQRSQWENSRDVVGRQIEEIPLSARITEADAKEHLAVARNATEKAGRQRDEAVQSRNELVARKQKHDQLTKDSRDSAEQHRLHKRLNILLGENGLQRELARDAEEQILSYANETLDHFSDGDLALEEDTAPDSTKTFDLRVRRAGGEPIGIAFLSGSQRFRVAVSIALAVGRFASGRARPLESVIIDEGFGSLDKDGLCLMGDELKCLQKSSSLKRVILVSHQEEFTGQFSVGYQLSPGDGGTTAQPFRR